MFFSYSLHTRIFPHEQAQALSHMCTSSRPASTTLPEAASTFGPAHQQSCYNNIMLLFLILSKPAPLSLPLHWRLLSTAVVSHLTHRNMTHFSFNSIQPFRLLWCSLLNVTARAASWLPCYMFIINFSQEDYSQYYYQMHFLSIEAGLVPKNTCDLFSP